MCCCLALNWWILVEYVYQLTFFSTVVVVNIILLAMTRLVSILFVCYHLNCKIQDVVHEIGLI
jgi:hypothetical protein